MIKSIGILGTSKNTGKTTTASILLKSFFEKKISVGLTSIGYDGEELDNVTGLPKPRIFMEPGSLVASAKSCFENSEAVLKILEETDIRTSLGEVFLGSVKDEGRIVLAGPSRGRDLEKVIVRMEAFGCSLALVDGALNRIVPLMKTDGIIIATGASRSTNIDYLASEISAMESIFSIPLAENPHKNINHDEMHILLSGKENLLSHFSFSSLIREEQVNVIMKLLKPEVREIFIPGLISLKTLKMFLEKSRACDWGRRIVFRNPTQLLVSGDTILINEYLRKGKENGFEFRMQESVPILAVTVNPFYPAFHTGEGIVQYTADYIDKYELVRSVRAAISIPVIDILEEGPEICLRAVNKRMSLW